LPETVVNGKTFEAWRERAEQSEPGLLRLALSDVVAQDQQLLPEHYPDQLLVHGVALAASYRFDPSADDDGVTLTVPLPFLPQLGQGELDWTIPAWHQRKIAALLDELPRALRRELGSISELAAKLAQHLRPEGPMLEALSRGLFELAGADVPAEAFRVDAIPAYLRFNCRIVGERGQLIAEGRDVVALREQHAARAREAVRRAPAPTEWERSELVTWDVAELPKFVTRTVLGAELRSYPALVDRQRSVALELLETEDAAETAHQGGVRRLLLLAAKSPLAALGKRAPLPFTRRLGLPAPRAEAEAFRDLVLTRVATEAFGLVDGAELPRSKAAFDRVLAAGLPRLSGVFELTTRAIAGASGELDKTLRALDSAAKHPSGTAAVADIRAQLAELFAPETWLHLERAQLEQFPRYLRAAQARLTRAINDPRKDASKAEPFTPVWQAFLAKRQGLRDPVSARRLHLAFEELRVALFAPELKPAQSVSVAAAAQAVAALR
jgi:ATP-dependent helicase HrpA